MAQFARPSADTSIGTYKDQADGVTNIYLTIDEASLNDADYIKSVDAPASAPYATDLTSVTDPVSSTGHTIRVRARQPVAGGRQVDLTAQIRQGYVSEGTPGTLIATLTQADVAEGTFTTYSYTLSAGEADSVTNYADLTLRVVGNQV